ncbi:FitA-like ribbon-helix-helix domain-containing protein [Candidatus Poriferisodalis sp.]|uniref:FitA-like ribbon-helix-helix domain-containing protein n=1 Tax=Candidatus Poriferisodalis sp. TaxID=3101277 RepID=UPI003B025956
MADILAPNCVCRRVVFENELHEIDASREVQQMCAGQRAVRAECWQRRQNAGMAVQITIRNVPEDVRDELAAKAAERRQSMQEFLRGELERLAAKPSVSTLLEEIRRRKEAAGTHVSAAEILAARDADRK